MSSSYRGLLLKEDPLKDRKQPQNGAEPPEGPPWLGSPMQGPSSGWAEAYSLASVLPHVLRQVETGLQIRYPLITFLESDPLTQSQLEQSEV